MTDENWYSTDTQVRWACLQLIKGREISQKLQIAESGGTRLSAIIYNLIDMDWPILKRYGAVGEAYYRLPEEVDADSLKKPRSFYPKNKGDARTPPSKLNISS